MEFVVLNIGYDPGILCPQVFTMIVIMALVTIFMTSPGLNPVNWLFKDKAVPVSTKGVITSTS